MIKLVLLLLLNLECTFERRRWGGFANVCVCVCTVTILCEATEKSNRYVECFREHMRATVVGRKKFICITIVCKTNVIGLYSAITNRLQHVDYYITPVHFRQIDFQLTFPWLP